MTDKREHSKEASPLEGPSDDRIIDDLDRIQHQPPHSTTTSFAKKSLYITISLVIAFVLLRMFGAIGFNVFLVFLHLATLIEWATLNILPWIFLYYFIQFVRSFIKGKQG